MHLCSRRFTTNHFTTKLYKSALGKRKASADECGGPLLHGPGVSAAVYDLLNQQLPEKCQGWCAEIHPELNVFRAEDRSVLLLFYQHNLQAILQTVSSFPVATSGLYNVVSML